MSVVDDASRAAGLAATALTLGADRVTEEIVPALQAEGIDCLLLKGPALANWLYDDRSQRTYVDCDLLVALNDYARGQELLSARGFERDRSADHLLPRIGPMHADSWHRRGDAAAVDLHRALPGMRMGAANVWVAMADRSETMRVGRIDVRVPRPAARALLVALHAAHHGASAQRPLEDLSRAIDRVPLKTWREAVEIAEALHATPSLTVGLRLLPAGQELAERLGLPSAELIDAVLGKGPGGRTALGFVRLAQRKGVRAKASLIVREMFPSPRFMRWWSRLARRGRAGLVLSYGWRLVWLLAQLGPGIRTWQRSRARDPRPGFRP